MLSDRYIDSSYAYQGGGRGIPFERIDAIAGDHLPEPDLTLLLDVRYDVARERLARRGSMNRLDQQDETFHGRVREAYWRRALDRERVRLIAANGNLQSTLNNTEAVLIAMIQRAAA